MFRHLRIICLFLAVTTVAACGGGAPAPAPAPAAAAYDLPSNGEAADSTEAVPEDTNRMIIRNAYVEIEADDSNALYSAIADKAAALGGYESYHDITNHETYSVINAEVCVPARKFNELIGYINDNGKVINSRVNSEDITEDYYDVEIRLETKRASLQKYYDLLGDAENVDEIIQLQRTIDEITTEIESMEGRLRLWSSQVNMSTVSLLIRQQNDPVKIRKDIDWNALSAEDMGYLITRGFARTVDYIVVLLQWLVIAVISLSPVLAVLAVVYFVSRKFGVKTLVLKRREKKPKQKKGRRGSEDRPDKPDISDAPEENKE